MLNLVWKPSPLVQPWWFIGISTCTSIGAHGEDRVLGRLETGPLSRPETGGGDIDASHQILSCRCSRRTALKWIRLAPMTAESIIVCAVVYASCSIQAALNNERFVDVQREWGAIHTMPFEVSAGMSWGDVILDLGTTRTLESFESLDSTHRVNELELNGPFDIWNGEWWRVPLTAFHHGNLFQLVLNLGAAWYLGSRLERCWGSFVMGLFLIPAACIPVMAELCWGRAVIGFSGVVCAMLGALVVLRCSDGELADEFPVEAAQIGMGAILLCWLASLFDIEPFPNAAHVTGFVYGGLLAAITGGPLYYAVNRATESLWTSGQPQESEAERLKRRVSVSQKIKMSRRGPLWLVVLSRTAVILAHLWLAPGLFLVGHPFWIGRYHWYRAIASQTPAQIEQGLVRAVTRDPSLIGAWALWSQLAESRGELLIAWKRNIDGLNLNPSSLPMIEGAQRLWRHLNSDQRVDAERELIEVFGERADLWLNQIRAGAVVSESISNEKASKFEDDDDISQFSLDQKIELPILESLLAQPKSQAPLIPADGNDAMEGKSL